jgi:hypothetical protein
MTLDITHLAVSWFDLGVIACLSLLHSNFQGAVNYLGGVSKHAVLKYTRTETAAHHFVGSTRNNGKPQTECYCRKHFTKKVLSEVIK